MKLDLLGSSCSRNSAVFKVNAHIYSPHDIGNYLRIAETADRVYVDEVQAKYGVKRLQEPGVTAVNYPAVVHSKCIYQMRTTTLRIH